MQGEKRLRLILWGTGKVAESIIEACLTLDKYEILGFIDNNENKWGSNFHGYYVYPPSILYSISPDRVVIASDRFADIKDQVVNLFPALKDVIENKYYFYKESILARYRESREPEILEVLDHIKDKGLDVFNYPFAEEYGTTPVRVGYDTINRKFYVIHNEKRMYMAGKFNSENAVVSYYRSILMEQDENSPHRYCSEEICVHDGDVVVDAGAAEGNFSIGVVDVASKIYIIESDPEWVEALKLTFRDYSDKVEIIRGYLTSYNEGRCLRLDSIIRDEINFIKMDIEGEEWDALQGAEGIIDKSTDIRFAICSYHRDADQTLIESFFGKHNISYNTTKGYMWFPYLVKSNRVSTRLLRGIVQGVKISK